MRLWDLGGGRDGDGCPCLLFFAGWAMDERPFAGLARPGWRLLVVADYRFLDLDLDLEALAARHQRLELCAWSMGVYVAALWLDGQGPRAAERFARRLAVAGTLDPFDSRLGIPPQRARAMLQGLDQAALDGFYADMFDHPEEGAAFIPPERGPDQAREELAALLDLARRRGPAPDIYTQALVPLRDRIVPPRAQARTWGQRGLRLRLGHFPFLTTGLPPKTP